MQKSEQISKINKVGPSFVYRTGEVFTIGKHGAFGAHTITFSVHSASDIIRQIKEQTGVTDE